MICDYCGHVGKLRGELELRHGKVVCADTKACDGRDSSRHEAYIRKLAKRRHAGDELSEAERQELADG